MKSFCQKENLNYFVQSNKKQLDNYFYYLSYKYGVNKDEVKSIGLSSAYIACNDGKCKDIRGAIWKIMRNNVLNYVKKEKTSPTAKILSNASSETDYIQDSENDIDNIELNYDIEKVANKLNSFDWKVLNLVFKIGRKEYKICRVLKAPKTKITESIRRIKEVFQENGY